MSTSASSAVHAGGGGDDRRRRGEAVDPGVRLSNGRRTGVGERESDAAQLAGLGPVEGAVGRVAVVDEHGVGERSERGGDGGLVAGLHLHRLGEQAAHPVDASGDQRCRAVLLVERQRQRLRARTERAVLAFAPVQLVADALDLGLGLEYRSLRELVRLVEVGLGGLAGVGGRLGLGECRCRARPALGRCLERVLVPQHLAAHGGELRRGRVGLPRELRQLEVVGRDERALAGDALVDGVEFDATTHGRLVGVVEGGCRSADTLANAVELGHGAVDHLAGDARRGIRLL